MKKDDFAEKIYGKKHIFINSSNDQEYLKSLGFKFTGKSEDNFFECSYPTDLWYIKPRWPGKPAIASIYDPFRRERIIVSLHKWRNDQQSVPELFLVPRFEIYGPGGDMNGKPSVRVFVCDHGYPFRHNKHILIDESEYLTEVELNENLILNGPTAAALLKKVTSGLEKKYPDYKNPKLYWKEDIV